MVRVDKQTADALIRFCKEKRPKEACGVLWGTADGDLVCVRDFEGVRNMARQPEQNFAFEPGEWIRVLYKKQSRSEQVVGIFHSHPSSPALPSASDLATDWRFPTYWIVSFADSRLPAVGAFRLGPEGTCIPQNLVIQ